MEDVKHVKSLRNQQKMGKHVKVYVVLGKRF